MNLAVFASGKGSNCRVIHEHIQTGKLAANIGLIISNVKDAPVLEFARKQNIPYQYLSREQFDSADAFHGRLLEALATANTDLIVLAGYLKKIGSPILRHYANRVLNIHPALLPAFGGKGMYGQHVHRAVVDYGAKVSGITIHLVDDEYDHGPVVMQKTVDLDDDETPDTLALKVQELEHRYYVEAIRLFVENRIKVVGRHISIH